jgi:hypothetical protein
MIIQWIFNGFAWPVNAGQSSLSGIGTGAQKQGVFFGAETARFERDVVADQDHLPTMPGFRGVHGKQPRHHPNVVLTPRTGRFHCSRCLFIARMGEKKRKRKENVFQKRKKKRIVQKESSKKNQKKHKKESSKKNQRDTTTMAFAVAFTVAFTAAFAVAACLPNPAVTSGLLGMINSTAFTCKWKSFTDQSGC